MIDSIVALELVLNTKDLHKFEYQPHIFYAKLKHPSVFMSTLSPLLLLLLLLLLAQVQCSTNKHRDALTEDAIAAATVASLALAFSLLMIFCRVCQKHRSRYLPEDSSVSETPELPKYQLNTDVESEDLHPPPPYHLASDIVSPSFRREQDISIYSAGDPPPYHNSSVLQGENCSSNNCNSSTDIV